MKNTILATFLFIFNYYFAQPGSKDNSFNVYANEGVYASAIQPDGKIIVAGYFTQINGYTRNKIVRLNEDGTIDPTFNIGSGFDGIVYDVELQPDGKLLVIGSFTTYNGTSRNRILRLNSNGQIDNTFNVGSGLSGGLNSLPLEVKLQDDGKIVVVGDITSYQGITKNRIFRILPNGDIDNGFNIGSGFNVQTSEVAIQPDGKLIVVGAFTSYNGVAANRIIRLNSDGTIDTDFNIGAGPDLVVQSVELQQDGAVLIGGQFNNCDGVSRSRIARLTSTGSLDLSFDVGTGITGWQSVVHEITCQTNGKILIAGKFGAYDGVVRNYLVRVASDGTIDSVLNMGAGFNDATHTIVVQNDSKIIVTGDFTTYNGLGAGRIIRLLDCYPSSDTLNIATCGGFTFDNIDYETSGTYIHNYTSVNGCDSTIVLNLNIELFSDIQYVNGSLSTTETGTYQWLDCSSNEIIVGENQSSFTPLQNGLYALIVSNGNCSDTSDCININDVGITDFDALNLSVYPNPTNDLITISFEEPQAEIVINDAYGNHVDHGIIKSGNQISLLTVQPGVYFLKINTSKGNATIRIVRT